MDYRPVINRCSDTKLAEVVFNGLLRGDVIDPDQLNTFKLANYDEYNELVNIAKYLTNDTYYANNLEDVEEVRAWKFQRSLFHSKSEAVSRRDRYKNVKVSDKFWIPKIGQIIYVINDYQLNMRRVLNVKIWYSDNDRMCEVIHEDMNGHDRDEDYIYRCFNKPEDCYSW
jgi:hypothetical protein